MLTNGPGDPGAMPNESKLVKELVDVLKGEIRVESEVGKGTTFYLSFPVDAETWGIIPAATTPITPDYSEGETLTPFLPEKIRAPKRGRHPRHGGNAPCRKRGRVMVPRGLTGQVAAIGGFA